MSAGATRTRTNVSPVTIAVLTGAHGALGHRVATALEDDFELVLVDDDFDAVDIAGADVVVDLGSSDHDRRASRRESATEFAAGSLALADRLNADHVVFVSSALVYGARDNNPFPLTEDAVLRPDVEFVFARQLASGEEIVEEWRRSVAGRATCVLRPVISLAAGRNSQLATALVSGLGQRFAVDDPPSQFLHLDDLASAVEQAVRLRLDGVYNVAPDGWVAGDRVRALSGTAPRIPMPDRVSEVVGDLRWRFLRGPIPPGLRPYTRESWVVSAGRLRSTGWTPTVTNEQAYVDGTEARWWTMVSPKRRQEIALGAGVIVLVVAGIVGLVLGRRWLRRRR